MNSGEHDATPVATVRPQSLWQRLKASRGTFWGALLFVGPFALPLLWRDSRYSRAGKIVITIGVCILTWFLMEHLARQVKEAGDMLRAYQEAQEGAAP